MKNWKSRLLPIVYGEIIIMISTVLVAYAFFDSSTATIIKAIAIVGALFLVVYVLWIKMHKSYEKMYKSGLKEE